MARLAAHPHEIVPGFGKDGRHTHLGLRLSAVLRGKGNEAVALFAPCF